MMTTRAMTTAEVAGDVQSSVDVAGFEPGPFEEQGYAILPKLASADLLAEFEAEIAAIADHQARKHGVTPEGGREVLAALFRRGGAYRTLLYKSVQQLPILSRISLGVFDRLRDGGVLRQFGFEAPLLACGMRVDIPGETKFLLPMHQDYAHLWSPRCLRVWLPLRPVDAQLGSMQIIPGSHRRGYIPHDTGDPRYPAVTADRYDPTTAVTLELDAGDGLLFGPYLLHASVPGSGPRIKFVMGVHIQDGGALIDPEDESDPVAQMMNLHALRSNARAESL